MSFFVCIVRPNHKVSGAGKVDALGGVTGWERKAMYFQSLARTANQSKVLF